MTVAYNFDVCSSTWLNIARILLRWNGSVWKAVGSELLFWICLHITINASLRNLLNSDQEENFKIVREKLEKSLNRIPLTFMLGFFVSVVFNRWSEIFKKIGFIDNLALVVSTAITGEERETRLLRRKIVRYAVLTQSLVFRDISLEVRKRFPDTEAIVNAGFMTDTEWDLYNSIGTQHNKYWMPIQWAMRLVWIARSEGKITTDVVAWQLSEKLREFRTDLQQLCCYDWVPVPLSYPQIVFIGVRSYFLLTVIARQSLKHNFFCYFPLMTLLELLLLIGWVKVAEQLLNPLGTDDDDFECNYVIDRNLSMGFEIVDNRTMPPKGEVDVFWQMLTPKPLDAPLAPKRKVAPYLGSVADVDVLSMEKQPESEFRKTTVRRRLNSTKSIVEGGEISMDGKSAVLPDGVVLELSPKNLYHQPKLNVVLEESSSSELERESAPQPPGDDMGRIESGDLPKRD